MRSRRLLPRIFLPFLLTAAAMAQTGVWKVTTPGYAHRELDGGRQWFGPDGDARRVQAGILLKFVDATPFRGKTVRLKSQVWLEAPGAMNRAQLWLRVDRPAGAMGFFDNMGDRPIVSGQKQSYEIVGDIAPDAEWVVLGVILNGSSAALLEGLALEEATDLPPLIKEPARPLTAGGLQNLQAFARIYGLVRFFHPAAEARVADWNRIAVEGVRQVESAGSPTDLAARLSRIFPSSVLIYTGAEPPSTPPPGELVIWKHTGFGGALPGLYKSELVKAENPEPLRLDLGGGVKALIPLAMPKFAVAEDRKSVPLRYSGDDRATRLAGVIIAWNVFDHFYPYFDVVGTDWKAQLPNALQRAAADKDAAACLTTLQLLVAALKDGHGTVSGPGGMRAPLALRLGWVEGRIVNLDNGDEIISIDGRPALEMLRETERLISGATPQWIRAGALWRLGSGAGPARVEVELFGAGPSGRKILTVPRGPKPQEKRPAKVAELEPGIWYADVTRCEDKDLDAIWPKLAEAKGVVFDLRGYPKVSPQWLRHLSAHDLQSPQWHVPVVTSPGEMTFVMSGRWELSPVAPLVTARRSVMTDGRSISYAESTLGIVENYKLAEIVGATTAGTNGNVNPFSLPGGYQVVWTGMKVLKHDGSRHHGVGIRPTIPVEPTRAGLAASRDEVLERALAAVK